MNTPALANLGCVLCLLSAGGFGCAASGPRAATGRPAANTGAQPQSPERQPRNPTAATPDVRFIPESEPYPAPFTIPASAANSDLTDRFNIAWGAAREAAEARVTVHNLVELSRWAKMETMGATLRRGWMAQLPMHAVATTADGRLVLFGQREPQESPVVMPSHAAVVQRRLMAGAAFDTQSGEIAAVFITIRGWAEE